MALETKERMAYYYVMRFLFAFFIALILFPAMLHAQDVPAERAEVPAAVSKMGLKSQTPMANKNTSRRMLLGYVAPVPSDAALLRAETLLAAGRPLDTMQIVDRVIARNPSNVDAYILAAAAWMTAGRLDRAGQALGYLERLAPKHMGATYLRGILALFNGQESEAQNYLRILKLQCGGDTCREVGMLQRALNGMPAPDQPSPSSN